MIITQTVHSCRACNSTDIVKNGKNTYGNQQYKCKFCGKCAVLVPKVFYTEAQKETILQAYSERSSLRGLRRTFGVAPPTVKSWLKKS